jgi:hypothetical protein
MKQLITLSIAIALIAGITSLNAQDMITYSDDFSYTLDFMTQAIPDTSIWEAWEVNAGTHETQNTDLLQLKADGFDLVIESSQGSFTGAAEDDGVFLYRTVPGGIDFEVQVRMTDGSFPTYGQPETYYNMAGIVIRPTDYNIQDIITLYFFELYGFHMVFKSIDDAAQAEQTSPWDTWGNFYTYPWMKLTRVGNTFTAYTSQDGTTWFENGITVDREDLADMDLRVGLNQCTFNVDTGFAKLDDFSLTHADLSSSVRDIRTNDFRIWSRDRNVVIESANDELILSAKLYSIDGRMIAFLEQVKDRRCEFRNLRTGLYIATAEIGGKTQTRKVIVR